MSAEAKRQVGIKTRAVKRLAADVRSYLTEKATHENAYAAACASGGVVEAHDIRRAREFVEEADATLRDVRQRLAEAVTLLQRMLGELAVSPEHQDMLHDPCMDEARNMLRDVAPLVGQSEAEAGAVHVRAMQVAVLGDSQINEDDALWRTHEQLGELLARGGFHILTGGYSGASEAVSFGASRAAAASAASAPIAGVTCPAAFANTPRAGATGPNQYLTEQTAASDIISRAHTLLQSPDVLLVMPGGLGTLAKLTLAWNVAAVEAWGGADASRSRTILAWRDPWEALLTSVSDSLRIAPDLMQSIKFVSSVEEVAAEMEQAKARRANAQGAAAAPAAGR